MICFTLEFLDTERDIQIVLQNLSLDMLHSLSQEGQVATILGSRYWNYGLYDKLKVGDYTFMVLKVTKKNVVLINTYE